MDFQINGYQLIENCDEAIYVAKTKEDVYQVAKSWNDATEEQIMDLYEDKLTAQRESIDNAHEFLYWTAA